MLFCILIGVETNGIEHTFNPRITNQYFLPAMRMLFPNSKSIEKQLTDGRGHVANLNLPKSAVMKACLPYSLQYTFLGSRQDILASN